MPKVIFFSGFMVIWALCCLSAAAADDGPVAWWKFDQEKGRVAVDSMSRTEDVISGNYTYTGGARGKAIKFDGYTAPMHREWRICSLLKRGWRHKSIRGTGRR